MNFCCKCSGIHINICIHTCMMLTIARTFMHVRFISTRIYLVLEHLNPWLRFLYRAQCHILPLGSLAFSIKLHFPADMSLHGHSTVYTIYSTFTNTQSRTHTLPASAYTPMQSTIIFGVISLVVRYNLYLILVIYVLHIRFCVNSLNQTQPHQVQSIFRLFLICTILYLG